MQSPGVQSALIRLVHNLFVSSLHAAAIEVWSFWSGGVFNFNCAQDQDAQLSETSQKKGKQSLVQVFASILLIATSPTSISSQMVSHCNATACGREITIRNTQENGHSKSAQSKKKKDSLRILFSHPLSGNKSEQSQLLPLLSLSLNANNKLIPIQTRITAFSYHTHSYLLWLLSKRQRLHVFITCNKFKWRHKSTILKFSLNQWWAHLLICASSLGRGHSKIRALEAPGPCHWTQWAVKRVPRINIYC